MKLRLFLTAMMVILLLVMAQRCLAECWRVTGYYTPIPGQVEYVRSFGWDRQMNGAWIMANGQPVYTGACAAPQSLPFGTRVFIPQLNQPDLPTLYTVCDRGGKIGNKRLDIWCGVGDYGRRLSYQVTGWYDVFWVQQRR